MYSLARDRYVATADLPGNAWALIRERIRYWKRPERAPLCYRQQQDTVDRHRRQLDPITLKPHSSSIETCVLDGYDMIIFQPFLDCKSNTWLDRSRCRYRAVESYTTSRCMYVNLAPT
nr:hypothetical protein CFP56_12212 [Quercus suber]